MGGVKHQSTANPPNPPFSKGDSASRSGGIIHPRTLAVQCLVQLNLLGHGELFAAAGLQTEAATVVAAPLALAAIGAGVFLVHSGLPRPIVRSVCCLGNWGSGYETAALAEEVAGFEELR